MISVTIYTPRKSPQRIKYYNSLSRYVDLSVISDQETPNDVLKKYNIDKFCFKNIILKSIPFFDYMGIPLNLISTIKKHYCDIYIIEHLFSPTGYLLNNYLHTHNFKYIANADGGGVIAKNKKSLKYKFKLNMMRKPTLWITSCSAGIKYLLGHGVNKNKIKTYIFSPYNKSDIINVNKNINLRNKLVINNVKVLFAAGQQIYRKGFDILINATNILNKKYGNLLVIIAGGEPNDACISLIKKYNIQNIKYVGLLNIEVLSKYYSISDIFVFPSRYDVYGFPIIEALLHGCPVVSSDAANAAIDIIKNGKNGYIFRSERTYDLVNKLECLLRDNKLMKKIRKSNLGLQSIYNSENMAKSIYNIIKNLYDEKDD